MDYQQYPETLFAIPGASFKWNLAEHNVKLQDESGRLFVSDQEASDQEPIIKVIEAGNCGTPGWLLPLLVRER